MESNTPPGVEMAETLCHFLRTALYLIKHGVSTKSKLLFHLIKTTRGGKAIKKALSDAVMVPSPAACRSRDDIAASYISPRPLRHYEFSCSNTPASTNFLLLRRRRRRRVAHAPPVRRCYDIADRAGGGYGTASEASPLVGGGAEREVRISDSPFVESSSAAAVGWGEKEGCHVVDREAERFIEMFYRELRLQKLMAAREAPDPYAYG